MSTKYRFKTSTGYQSRSDGIPPSVADLWTGFTETTTAHGITHIVKATGAIKKIGWIIISLGGVGLFTYSLVSLVLTYLQFNVYTNVILINKQSLPFPAVTVCNTNPVPDTSAQKNERIAQLLASWGIYFNDTSTNNTSSHTNRKKRQVNQDAFDDASNKYEIEEDKPPHLTSKSRKRRSQSGGSISWIGNLVSITVRK